MNCFHLEGAQTLEQAFQRGISILADTWKSAKVLSNTA